MVQDLNAGGESNCRKLNVWGALNRRHDLRVARLSGTARLRTQGTQLKRATAYGNKGNLKTTVGDGSGARSVRKR